MQLLGNPPRDRLVIGNASNKGFLAAKIKEHGKGSIE
jgi:hypothetical protein